MASKLEYAIGNITTQPVKYFVYSHSHCDHVSGAYLSANQSGVKSITHEKTAYALSYVLDPLRPVHTEAFRHNHTIHLGNQTLELPFKGPCHDFGSIFIFAPKQKVLIVVDTFYPGWVPFGSLAESVYILAGLQRTTRSSNMISTSTSVDILGGRAIEPTC
jgi:glyoxylase-like metal-dependent hydrolase (beta-lactamase superfamily II)